MPEKRKPQNNRNKTQQEKIGGNMQSNKKGNTGNVSHKKAVRSAIKKAMPYFFMVFALILCIFFVTVKLLNIDDGVGVLGYWIQFILCGLLGPAAYGLPLIFGYVGVKWCLYNITWKSPLGEGAPDYPEYKKARKRLITQGVMSALVIFTIASMFGVFADYGGVDIPEMWTDAAENGHGGGIVGSLFGALMVLCFKQLVSTIILVVLLVFFAILMIGLTPDYIIEKLQQKQRDAKLQRAEREAEEKMSAMGRNGRKIEEDISDDSEDDRKRRNRMAAAGARVAFENKENKNDRTNNEKEVLDGLFGDIQPEAAPNYENAPEKEVYIGPSVEESEKALKNSSKNTNDLDFNKLDIGDDAPKDYGDDTAYDSNEFTSLEDVLGGLPTEDMKNQSVPTEAANELDLGEIENEELLSDVAAVAPNEDDEEEPEIITPYIYPPIELLSENKNAVDEDHSEELKENARNLVETLKSFRVGVKEITYSRGPTITRYELKPEVGIRVRAIANLVDDIALSLATSGVRIEAPIPGKPAVGIEVPNRTRATVYLRDLIESPKFTESKSKLTACLGMDVGGNPIHFDIGKMPHLLIAGTTGSGKSICINCIIVSILYKAKPEELKLILIDPKKVEFNMYKNIPHLYCPIVSEPKKAAGALASAVGEMERRFELIEKAGVRDIASYNAAAENNPDMEFMPHMVIIIDELADLMMTARDEVESSICRIAQKARAAGIHMILGTQRPSVDVITGLIKANVPSRIACTVMSQVDSRTIIDVAGAESLIGRGDMLFAPVGASKPMRVQGAFVSEVEIDKIVSFVKENNGQARYNTEFINRIEEEAAKCGMGKKGASSMSDFPSSDGDGGDNKLRDAIKLAVEEGKISTSLMQRRLGVGYGRAAKIIDTMEELGYVSKPDGNKPRRVLLTMDEFMRRSADGTLEGGASGEE
ncbi:MAG: DNA translocase FtsK [Clostridia bacterium]|nr:DNA translocase FtsK [Clostridia bacterium]